MSFNLSNPAPIKSNEKKVAWYEKVWAGLNLISLFGEGLIPKGVKDNVSIKWRNIGILMVMAILVYFICSGVYYNARLIIEATKNISFSLGDSFYYYGIIVIVFTALQYFNLDKEIKEFGNLNIDLRMYKHRTVFYDDQVGIRRLFTQEVVPISDSFKECSTVIKQEIT